MGNNKQNYINKYNKEKTAQVSLRFQKDDRVYIALQKASTDNGIKATHYAKVAILNQLKEDGYIPKLADITIRQQGEVNTSHPKK